MGWSTQPNPFVHVWAVAVGYAIVVICVIGVEWFLAIDGCYFLLGIRVNHGKSGLYIFLLVSSFAPVFIVVPDEFVEQYISRV